MGSPVWFSQSTSECDGFPRTSVELAELPPDGGEVSCLLGVPGQHSLMAYNVAFSKSKKTEAEEKWFDDISPIGQDPWTFETRYNTFAGLDDCDFNGHLSNSSYPKAVDAARFKAGLAMCSRFFAAGGSTPLAAMHFKFVREIPMLTPYEVRISIGGWDHKWIYLIAKFVTKPKSKKHVASIKTPNGSTPTNPDEKLSSPTSNGKAEPEMEADGAILHTVGVVQLCCKIGRITIPPAIVLALSGFSVAPPLLSTPLPDGDFASQSDSKTIPQRYSHTNPPPHWIEVKRIQARTHGGSWKKLKAFLKGAWKHLPVEERWWDKAMGGEVEEGRKRAMEMLGGLAQGYTVGK
ncbi:hypothetical protein H0H93_009165 [Arthromyces matolae]|nr:hypothetical protein H0H93_009165 [Arthromyces matolae]